MIRLCIIILCLLLSSCIPLRIAPSIENGKVMKAKEFKRKLPRDYAYIFNDPKEANEFYNYLNSKFWFSHTSMGDRVSLVIRRKIYFLSYEEVEKVSKTINLFPIVIDAILDPDGDLYFEDLYTERVGEWYLVLFVEDMDNKDSLKPNYADRREVLYFLNDLRLDYLTADGYDVPHYRDNEIFLPR